MNRYELLNVIGQAQEEYIIAAADTQSLIAQKSIRIRRNLLIAAVFLLILILTACAAVFGKNLFTAYFQSEQTLSDSQIDYIENNTQFGIAASSAAYTANGYDLTVTSALTDGVAAYITVEITAPEGTSLEGGQIRFLENPRLIPTPADGLVLAPDGSAMDAMCDYVTLDDGDERPNTASLLFRVNLFTENADIKPFDGSIRWRLEAGDFEKSVFQGENVTRTPLGTGTWAFDLQLENLQTRELEFVKEPISQQTSNWLENEYTHENRILSLTLSGLNVRLSLEHPEVSGKMQDIGDVSIVLRDGGRQTLICLTAQSAPLNAPIDLDAVDYILLANGRKLFRREAVAADPAQIKYNPAPTTPPADALAVDPFPGYTAIPQPQNRLLEVHLPEGTRWEDTGREGGLFYQNDILIGGYKILHFEKGILPKPFENEERILTRLKEALADQIDLSDFQGKITTEGEITAVFTKGDREITWYMSPVIMPDYDTQYGLWADTAFLTEQEISDLFCPFLVGEEYVNPS